MASGDFRSAVWLRLEGVLKVLALATAVFIFLWQPTAHAAPAVDPPPLRFNEIHARPAEGLDGDANGDGMRSPLEDEFVELVNAGDHDLDLSGWTLADETSVRHTFPTGTALLSKQALVLFGGGFPSGAFGGAQVQLASSGALYLDNNFDTLTLSAPDGQSVVLSYDASLSAGQSITRHPDLEGPWTPHLEASGGTGRYSPGTTVDGRAFLPAPPADEAPQLISSVPASGAQNVSTAAALTVTFSEAVVVDPAAFDLDCPPAADLALAVSGGPITYTLQPALPLPHGRACTLTLQAEHITDSDASDPPDHPEGDEVIHFRVAVADFLLINEIDALNALVDTAEFIEIYDGARGHTKLDGLVLVLYDGQESAVYARYDLAGYQTDAAGYFVVGGDGLPGGAADLLLPDESLDNGYAAVALYEGDMARFPIGAPVDTAGIVDAVVYRAAGPESSTLLPLLLPGQPAANEDERDTAGYDSSQRCPNGSGGQRQTLTFGAAKPTPRQPNVCVRDEAPRVVGTTPADGATRVPRDTAVSVTFSEAVSLYGAWAEMDCPHSGRRIFDVPVTGLEILLPLDAELAYGETCTVSLHAQQISDLDAADPPDHPLPHAWSFTVRPAEHILINEVDADTPGLDTAEFVELYDGGSGNTPLDGLVLVLYNGNDDVVYRAIELTGMQTDAQGYFVVRRETVSWLQNGPDAVALYAGAAAEFPSGTAVTTTNLLDALVYSTSGESDPGLQPLLSSGQSQVNEDGRAAADLHSSQRCPNGAGGQRNTGAYLPNNPTPGIANNCLIDNAPAVANVAPAPDSTGNSLDAAMVVQFTEQVAVATETFTLRCASSGAHQVAISGGPVQFALQPDPPFVHGETCQARVIAAAVHDLDAADPPDDMAADYVWSFSTAVRPVARHILINEVDADTPGLDTAEFIELYDGGSGNTPLDGLVLVLYNGSDDAVYRAIDLAGMRTDAGGYFVVRRETVSWLQNGPDGVALYAGSVAEFPAGTAVTTTNLLDALVYNTSGEVDPGLQALLLPGQPQVNEDGRAAADLHSSQRCPNGAGGQRNTGAYLPNNPTPGAPNHCVIDDAPAVTAVTPAPNSAAVSPSGGLTVSFTEPVFVTTATFTLRCDRSGPHELTLSGGPLQFDLRPQTPFVHGETCQARVAAAAVHDLDTADPPDIMAADYVWSFSTAVRPVARHILINEVDADTPGLDTAEFIELYDGGSGDTPLDGLALAFYNGSDDAIYRVVALDGLRTDARGFFLLAGPDVPHAHLALPVNTIQNGPDAVALYVAGEAGLRRGGGVTVAGLLDALVYHTADDPDPGLLPLLLPGQTAVDEAAWRPAAIDSNQRCPHGQGAQRDSSAFLQNAPTPGVANNCQLDLPPAISAVSPAEGAQEADPADALLVTFSEPVQVKEGWLALACDPDQKIPLAVSGGPQVFSARPAVGTLPPRSHCTAVIRHLYVTDGDGYADPLPADYAWQFSTGGHAFAQCGDPATLIHDLPPPDGPGAENDGPLVTIEAVVTGAFQGADALGGFFVQEQPADADGDLSTADALFVHDGAELPEVSAGQVVRLQGTVTYSSGLWHMRGVQAAQICPGTVTIPPYGVALPLTESGRMAQRQGLLLEFTRPLTIVDTAAWATDGRLLLADAWQPYPTAVVAPGGAAQALAEAQQQARLILDDGHMASDPDSPPYLGPEGTLRAGDLVLQLTGVFSPTAAGEAYFQPTQPVQIRHENPRPDPPPRVNGRARLALLDAGDFHNGDGQGGFSGSPGAATGEELLRQRAKLIGAILAIDADILAVTGLENDGEGEASATRELVSALNAASAAGPVYAAIHPQIGQPIVLTMPAMLYRSDRVLPSGRLQSLDVPSFAGQAPPLRQGFVVIGTGHEFALVVLDLATRDQCASSGAPDADQGDGQGCGNARRTAQAAALVQWIEGLATDNAERGVILLGEFNAYALEDPLRAFVAGGLQNLTDNYLGESGYDRLQDGWAGSTRHAFASQAFAAEVAALVQWHHNAAEPPALDYHLANPATLFQDGPYRAASRDTLIIDLGTAELQANFRSDSPQPIGRAIRFTNETTPLRPVTFSWDFGDGSPPVTAVHPRHLYPTVGEYQVTLRVTTAWGDTAVHTATVRIAPAQLAIPFVIAQP